MRSYWKEFCKISGGAIVIFIAASCGSSVKSPEITIAPPEVKENNTNPLPALYLLEMITSFQMQKHFRLETFLPSKLLKI